MHFGRRRIPTLLLACPILFLLYLWWDSYGDAAWSSAPGLRPHGGKLDPAAEDDPTFIWRTLEAHYPASSIQAFPKGRPKSLPKIQKSRWSESKSERQLRLERLAVVKASATRGWASYRKHAWAKDELSPVSGKSSNRFGGWGATLVDALDMLWIMGMKEEFEDAVAASVDISFANTTSNDINVFETTIRYLGGFLGAYDLSGDTRLLRKAKEVGDMLYVAFDTPNRMPITRWELHDAILGVKQEAHTNTLLAEIGSLTMEFTRLSMVTGDMKFFDAVNRIMEAMRDQQMKTQLPGMWPILINARTLDFTSHNGFTLNAMSDSMYEYLPKMHALAGGLLPMYEDMYKKSMETVLRYTVFRPMLPDDRDVLVSGAVSTRVNEGETIAELNPEGQHLACFTGGMLALGGKLFNLDAHVEAGRKLVEGCVWTYEALPSGIMPESFYMIPCPSAGNCHWDEELWKEQVLARADPDLGKELKTGDQVAKKKGIPKGFASIPDPRYHLRPEAIESVFILYRITGRKDLLDTAWKMWEAIDANTRTELANSALDDITVTDGKPVKTDVMESFWFGETLKYFYLIFSEPDLISLDEYVFNTEAHPFKRYTR